MNIKNVWSNFSDFSLKVRLFRDVNVSKIKYNKFPFLFSRKKNSLLHLQIFYNNCL